MSVGNRLETVFGPGAGDIFRSPRTMAILASSLLMMMNAEMFSPLLPMFIDHYGVSETSVGVVMTALTLPPVLFIPLMGTLADRYPRRYVLGGSLLLVGVGGLAIAFTTSFRQVIALRVLQGVGYSGVMPITVALLGDLYTDARETTAQGVRTFLNNGAASLFPAVGGLLLAVSWRAPFALYLIHFPVAALALWLVPDTVSAADDDGSGAANLAALFRSPHVVLLMVAAFTMFFLRYGVITALPIVLIREFGVPVTRTGIYVGVVAGCAAIGASQAGRVSEHFSQTALLRGALALAGVFLLALPFAGVFPLPLPATIVLLVAYGLSWGLTTPTQKSLLNQAVSTEIRARTISVSYTLQNVGKALAPLAVGVAISVGGFSASTMVLGACALLTAGALLVGASVFD